MAALHLLHRGQAYVITALGDDRGGCEVLEFLQDRGRLTTADEGALQDLFIRHGDHGQVRNEAKCRSLGDGIWEYKAPGGGRVAWFYDAGWLVVCACGTVKKKQKADPAFIKRAAGMRDRYFLEKGHGQIRRHF